MYTAQNVPVRLMIMLMFHLTDAQVSGGPDWTRTGRWDVSAKAEHPAGIDELHIMFQNLLIDRFGLRFHHETRELPAYVLSVDKSGPKLTPNTNPEPFDVPIKGEGSPGKIAAQHCSMYYFTWFLSGLGVIGKPVVDKTGLSGFYDFQLEWMPMADPKFTDVRDPSLGDRPMIFTAVREQLGLRLEAQKAPVEVMVIDQISKPERN